MRPIAHARNEAMLDGVDITVRDMPGVVSFVADHVLPKPPLPDAALIARLADRCAMLPLWQRFRKGSLDETPARREIRIAGRQRPDGVNVVRQHDESVDFEGILGARAGDRLAKPVDVVDEEGLSPFKQIGGEEPASARNEGATIIRHGLTLSQPTKIVGGLRFANPPYALATIKLRVNK